MADVLGGTYNTGLLTVANGSTAVLIAGALLTTQAVRGDWIFVPTANLVAFVDSVTDDQHIVLGSPWASSSQTAVEYLLIKMSWSRYDPALTQQKVRELLAFYEGLGLFYFVVGSAPDPGVGIDGQYALKINSGPWKTWYHTGGVWVPQGTPAGIQLQGPWNIATTYVSNDVVTWQGTLYSSKVAGNVGNQPDSHPTQWDVLLANGDRYDIYYFDTDRPASGELVNKCFPIGVTFPIGVAQSYASAEVAATGTAVYAFRKNGSQFATLTFSPGQTVGVFSCPVATSFAHGDVLTQYAPVFRDDTLSGIASNLIGFRS